MLAFLYRFRFRLALATVTAAIIPIYLFLATAGQMDCWPSWNSNYYDQLAQAFARGQTSLLIKPDPRLLALPDPYDFNANEPFRLHDALLYQGRYYLYWGPVPALLLAPLEALEVGPIDDSYLAFVFACGTLIFSVLLIRALWFRLFRKVPWWTALPLVVAVGLSNTVPVLLCRPLIYEAAIAGGQCFLIAGLYWIVSGLPGKQLAPWRLLLGGICLALAIGTRISLVFAVGFLCIMVLGQLARLLPSYSTRRVLVTVLLFGTPPLLGVIGLGYYNYARFGSWSEMGVRYQLNAASHEEIESIAVSFVHCLPNLYNYFLRLPGFQPTFPYLTFTDHNDLSTYPDWIPLPDHSLWGEGVIAGFVAFPFFWAAVVPFGFAVARLLRRQGASERAKVSPRKITNPFPVDWFVLCLAGVALLAIFPATLIWGSVTRYMADAGPTFAILAAIGCWQVYGALVPWRLLRSLALVLISCLAFASAVFGMLMAVAQWGFYGWLSIPEWNPQLAADPAAGTAWVLRSIVIGGALYLVFAIAAEMFFRGSGEAPTPLRRRPIASPGVRPYQVLESSRSRKPLR